MEPTDPRVNVVEMRDIVKTFPGGLVAVNRMNLDLRAGEIHSLLGENGAGKTTLMNVLYGLLQPDEGEIRIFGAPASLSSPHDAIRLGIGMVHQHFTLVSTLTVTENVILGEEPRKGVFLDMLRSRSRVKELAARYGLAVDPNAEVSQLSAGEKRRVEILKALYRNARILILDEPTVSLTPKEILDLMETLRVSVKKENLSVIIITHNLPEALKASDRITVLRKGRVVGTVNPREATEQSLAQMMVGKDVVFETKREEHPHGAELLRVENITTAGEVGMQTLKQVSFSLFEGEILGIAGVSGNGQNELPRAVLGLQKVTGGKVWALGRDITNGATNDILRQGIGFIPEDRKKDGTVGTFSIAQNLVLNVEILSHFSRPGSGPFGDAKSIRWTKVNRYSDEKITEYNILCSGRDTLADHLSGGNLQKCILAREISREPKILIAQNPDVGLDVGATEFVRSKLLEQRRKNVGILLISEDLDEIMNLCDRIAVMKNGRIVGILDAESADRDRIGLMMSGAAG